MWKLVVFITAIALACLLTPFTVLGLMLFGPSAIAALCDRFCRA